MYDHARTNRIIGWSLGGLALVVYLLTTAPVVSFWDNGEFVAVGYTLGVGHPPGSPVYTLITRLFALIPFPNVARAINFESILAGALAIAFFYFALTRMARRWEGKIASFGDGIPTYVMGITACLFAAFSYSFWENALEAEVYATNIFIMAMTLWLVLRWSELGDVPRDRRRLYLIIYLLSLGVGVHMGCLLWAPAFLVFVILFERSLVGLVFLGIPLALAFIMLTKGVVRGAIGIAILWLAATSFYALPALWPKPPVPGRKKRVKPKEHHPAELPSWFVWSFAGLEAILLFATKAGYGGGSAGWFAGCAAGAGFSIYLFSRLIKSGFIERPEIPARMTLSVVALAAVAVSVHAYLLIRARLKPAINEADPHTWSLVLDVIRRKQYEPMRFFPRRTPFPNQFRILWGYYRIQFPAWPPALPLASIPATAMAVWGAIAHARKDRRTFAMLATAFVLASIGLLFYLNISDHEVRPREYFWVPAYVGLALWMGIGSGAIVRWAKRLGPSWRNIMAVVLIAFALLPLKTNYELNDRSDNYVAYYYGWNLINFLEEDSLLITNGDNDTFPLWYLQQVEGVRPDVDIVNLSLVQINWYVKQLKEAGVPMSFTFDEIERMRPYWTRDPETGEPRLVSLRDIAIPEIIRANNWERPIYFAVTVDDFMGYYDNLSLEGMAFRLVPERGRHQVNIEKTRENVFENYRYDSIVDKENNWEVVPGYKPPSTSRLVTNYAAGFSRLGFQAMQEDPPDVESAIELYEISLKFAPRYGPALNGLIAIYAARLVQPEKALPYAEALLEAQPTLSDAWIRYGGVHLMIGEKLERLEKAGEAIPHFEEGMRAYERALELDPSHREIYRPLLSIYQKLGMTDKFNTLIDRWQREAPQEIRAIIDRNDDR